MGQPLPYALRTEDGALLANKGFVIQSRPELDRLRDTRAIFIDTQTFISRSAAVRLNAMLDQDTTLGEIADTTLAELEPLRHSPLVRDTRMDWHSMQLRANRALRDVSGPDAMHRLQQLHHDLSQQVLRSMRPWASSRW